MMNIDIHRDIVRYRWGCHTEREKIGENRYDIGAISSDFFGVTGA